MLRTLTWLTASLTCTRASRWKQKVALRSVAVCRVGFTGEASVQDTGPVADTALLSGRASLSVVLAQRVRVKARLAALGNWGCRKTNSCIYFRSIPTLQAYFPSPPPLPNFFLRKGGVETKSIITLIFFSSFLSANNVLKKIVKRGIES